MSNAKKARRKRRLRKLRRIGLILVGVVFVGWIFYLGATWGPQSIDTEPVVNSDPGSRELVEKSEELERQFEAIAKYREPTDEELDLLREALDLQRRHNLGRRPTVNDRRRGEALEARLGHFLAKELHERSVDAERESEALLAAGETVEAVEKVREAYQLQRKVNVEYGRGEFGDRLREAKLEQQLASMEAAPLHQRSLELEAEADRAIADFRWEEAGELLAEARELQVRINSAPRRSAYYNSNRIQVLDGKAASLQVGMKMSEIKDLTARGKALEENRQWEMAAQTYERAMVLQNQINREHPQSPFASREGAVALDEARQTALSAPEGQRLEATVSKMRVALREGDLENIAALASEAQELAVSISETFSRSRYVTPALRLELGYIGMAAPALPGLQALLREGLVSMPGNPGSRISSGFVSQELFAKIMNANPSQHPGPDLPVDSVTLKQAREFCRRASWILGEPVRLPEKADFEAASESDLSPLTGKLRTWLSDTGEGGAAWTAGWGEGEALSRENLFQTISSATASEPDIGLRYVVGGEAASGK